MIRTSTLAIPSLLFAAACAGAPPSSPPGTPGTPGTPGVDQPGVPGDQAAVGLGMTVMSRDAAGAPRLMRSIVPRAAAAGMAPADAARDHVSALAPLWVNKAPAMALTENGTQRLRNGSTIVKLTQTVDGVLVHNSELRVMMHASGALAAISGTLLPAAAKPSFVASPHEALEHALDQLYGKTRARPAITELGERSGWQELAVAASPDLKVTSARARRELVRVDNQMVPVWSLEVSGNAPADPLRDASIPMPAWRSYLVADRGGRIVSEANLLQQDAFVYRAYAEKTGNRRPLDGPLADFSPHPTGVPDGSAPGFVDANLVVMEAFNQTFDKWLPDNATTTSGNNVDAFSDLDGTEDFTEGDLRPEVRAGRTLNYHYDPAAEPLSSVEQMKAGATNVFFVTNWMHDWWYDSGFTEATGNAQVDNYGRGGVGGDPLVALAQKGALVGDRDNAFMGTPADGGSPHMLMLLWSSGTRTVLTAPSGVIASAGFVAEPHTFDLTGDVTTVDDGVAPGTDACSTIPADLSGKIALVTFSGACGSLATVNNVKAAGAIGIILADGTLDTPRLFAGSAAANIPGLAIGKTDGLALVAALAAGPLTVTLTSGPTGPERDGDIDNTIVAHEWGHYLHHRLAVCDAGPECGGMSEGWGDFNALMLMLREGDHREGTYAMSPYAIDDGTFDAAYFGLRRFPYSIDRTKNDLSFRHVADENPLPTATPGRDNGIAHSENHNVGEVWASMLWETYNILIDAHDVPTARRRMSDYVVAGLLMTPPDATFTEARDAILAAASALDSDDMLLMAAAFAGRGAGSCAVSPANSAPGYTGVVESGTLAAKLEVSGLSLIDDGVSCDHDGILDPGESGQLRVTVINSGVVDAEGVTVTATTTNAGVRLGAPIKIPALHPFTSASLTFPVTLLATAPRGTDLAITVRATGDQTCDRAGVATTLVEASGIDEVAAAATIDHVETQLTPWTLTGDGAASLWGRAAEANRNHLWFGVDAGFPSDTQLVSPALVASATERFVVTLSHAFSLEGGAGTFFDGGMIEASTDGGATWTDVSALGVDPGYTGPLFVGSDNPLAGRPAFSGTSPGFPARTPLVLDFGTRFAGQSVQIRFRIGTDAAAAASGWAIDDVQVTGITNTPFPAIVAEPSTCTARRTGAEDSGVIAIHAAPATSLASFDSVCVSYDNP